jgi:hypothetical protein
MTDLIGPYKTGEGRLEIVDPETDTTWQVEERPGGWKFAGPGTDWTGPYSKASAIARCKEAAIAYRSGDKKAGDHKPVKTTRPGPAPTRKDLRHFEMVKSLGCAVADKHCSGRLEIHHVRLIPGERRKHDQVIALCSNHHRDGGHGVAFHAGQGAWEDYYEPIEDTLERVRLAVARRVVETGAVGVVPAMEG